MAVVTFQLSETVRQRRTFVLKRRRGVEDRAPPRIGGRRAAVAHQRGGQVLTRRGNHAHRIHCVRCDHRATLRVAGAMQQSEVAFVDVSAIPMDVLVHQTVVVDK